MTKEEFKRKIKEHNLEKIYTYDAFTEAGYQTFNDAEEWPDDDKSYGVYHDKKHNKWVAYINGHEWSEHRTYNECENICSYSVSSDDLEKAYDNLFALLLKYNRLNRD